MQFRVYRPWSTMVNSDKKTEKVLREKDFRFTLVKIELVVAHPCFYVIYTWNDMIAGHV